MKIQPRQQLLEIWRATVKSSLRDRQWAWGGRERANSVTDAEQLLCLILPATELSTFALDAPDQTQDEVLEALRPLGNATGIRDRLIEVLTDYYRRYSLDDGKGAPLFHGGALFAPADPTLNPTDAQLELEVVESYAVSITLTLNTISFARSVRKATNRPDVVQGATELEELASRRLTAAMVGLLRSFTINAFDIDSDAGQILVQTVNLDRRPQRSLIDDLRNELRDVTAAMLDLTRATGAMDLDNPNRLYECGWSWGVIKGAPLQETVEESAVLQREGYALDAPYLYFTVVALDGIADLYHPRVTLQDLLTDTQLQLANALRLRWEHTQQYWATVASFGRGRWPLEDVPWRTTDGVESDYFSLLVTAISARALTQRRGSDADLRRLGVLLTELANRARITRKTFPGDVGAGQHFRPGVVIALEGSDAHGPPLTWEATDFSPVLLKRAIRVAEQIKTVGLRAELVQLVDHVWDHLQSRKHKDDRESWHGLWDQPTNAFPDSGERYHQPSWHHTFRVVEGLRYAANLIDGGPLPDPGLSAYAANLLAEAEHALDQELLAGSTEAGPQLRTEIQLVRSNVDRARTIIAARPGAATALLVDALRRLEQLTAARAA